MSTTRRAPGRQGGAEVARIVHGDDTSLEARIGKKITIKPNGCWAYLNRLDRYGSVLLPTRGKLQREAVPAHRWFYETLVGPIPEDHHVHHECENKGCVNPAHLVALSPGDHQRRHAEMRRTA